MYLSYDVVKFILEIKYKNWINEKMCLCGGDDYKTCDIVECYSCPKNYCLHQKGFNAWVWACHECHEYHCGNHTFRMNFVGDKFCNNCISPENFEMAPRKKIKCLPTHKLIALHINRTKQINPPPESPEY